MLQPAEESAQTPIIDFEGPSILCKDFGQRAG